MSTTPPPFTISDEAREAARQIRTSSVKSLAEHFVQLAINSATEKLNKEVTHWVTIYEDLGGRFEKLTKERAAREELTKEFLVKLSGRITVLENDLDCAREISWKLTARVKELENELARLNGRTNFFCECGGIKIELIKLLEPLRNLYNETLCLKTVENERLYEAFNEAEKALGIRS